MIKLTMYPNCNQKATMFKNWFANLIGLIPIKRKDNAFCFAPKENSKIITCERIFQVLQRELHFLEVKNYSIKEM